MHRLCTRVTRLKIRPIRASQLCAHLSPVSTKYTSTSSSATKPLELIKQNMASIQNELALMENAPTNTMASYVAMINTSIKSLKNYNGAILCQVEKMEATPTPTPTPTPGAVEPSDPPVAVKIISIICAFLWGFFCAYIMFDGDLFCFLVGLLGLCIFFI